MGENGTDMNRVSAYETHRLRCQYVASRCDEWLSSRYLEASRTFHVHEERVRFGDDLLELVSTGSDFGCRIEEVDGESL